MLLSVNYLVVSISVSGKDGKNDDPLTTNPSRTMWHVRGRQVLFAHLALPHSHIEYTLPLVKSVADDTVSDRFPAKRGLMPDVEVPLTYEEFFAPDGDPAMEKALEVLKSK